MKANASAVLDLGAEEPGASAKAGRREERGAAAKHPDVAVLQPPQLRDQGVCDEPDRACALGWEMASLWRGTLVWWAFWRDAGPDAKVREALAGGLRERCLA